MNKPKLEFVPVVYNKELVPQCIYDYVNKFIEKERQNEILVTEINPNYAEGHKLREVYSIDKSMGFNCLIVECKRNNDKKYCALIVPIGYKYNMSNVVRKYTNSRMISVAPLEYVLEKTGMEYGSITPIGLPTEWEILIDPLVKEKEKIIIGGGLAKSKIMIPVDLFLKMPKVKILENLAKK
jgi:prolyl-tRNA editing enzyme YbaK/EbsC (Cys-tRNA(Pro) deacylase)